MIPCLIIHPDHTKRGEEAEKILIANGLSKNHPDLLWFDMDAKLGIEQSRKIKEFLNLKPYQGDRQGIVILAAEELTLDAQNALLKTLEEPPKETVIILGVGSEDQLLSTIISRCQVVYLNNQQYLTPEVRQEFQKEIEKLLESSVEQRFQFIEKLENKEEFLQSLILYFRHDLLKNNHIDKIGFIKDLMEAEKWAKQNVNIRAILEYLMLKLVASRQNQESGN